MNPLIFKILKIIFFIISGYISGRIIIRLMNKKRAENFYSISDPEIITVSVLSGAVITAIFFRLLPRLFQ